MEEFARLLIKRYQSIMARSSQRKSTIEHKRELESVLHAMKRYLGGTYGTCECCKEAIPRSRLVRVPQARTCSRCLAKWGQEWIFPVLAKGDRELGSAQKLAH